MKKILVTGASGFIGKHTLPLLSQTGHEIHAISFKKKKNQTGKKWNKDDIKNKTKITMVRFGNVLGSRGSVFQIFQKQIRMQKPLTVTDRNMTRFIMSISDAASMILNVTKILTDGEIYILKMPSVVIENLAIGMLSLIHI